jgi:hypothetical protein
MSSTAAKFIAPSGMPAPVLWGDDTVVLERIGHGVSDLKMTRRHYTFTYPFPPADVVEFFRGDELVVSSEYLEVIAVRA